jgi:murein DD-endopeptidase MepM/ murein hydrolase activator NlpD
MKRSRKLVFTGILLFLLAPLTWLVWSSLPLSGGQAEPLSVANADSSHSGISTASNVTDTPRPTAESTPLPAAKPTDTMIPPPTFTPIRTSTSTPRPSETPSPTASATGSPTAVPVVLFDTIDRTCPNPSPLKPEYSRYFVPAQSWPEPEDSGEEHFWLSHPFEGGGRLLITDWFPYGYDAGGRYLIHNGLDVSEPLGTPILAMADGTVVVAGDDYNRLYGWRCDWYGHLVVIELDEQWRGQPVYLLYGHVLGISVQVGQHVSRGEPVAEVGVGGAATLPHLHFEIRVGSNEFGSTRNPLLWVRPPASRGLLAGRVVDPEGRPWQGVAINAVGISEETENYTSWSYLGDPQNLINPDEVLAENFVFGDMRPGRYEIYILLQGVEYKKEVEIVAGALTTIEIVTEPLKTATPEPTPEPENTPQPEGGSTG